MALNQVGLERLNTATTKKIGKNKNLIINGAMEIAQRGTTYTGANNYNTVDRFKVIHSGLNEDVTSTQVDVSSGTTPYSLGFRKAWKITNGNQTGGAGAADLLSIQYRIEAQDLASSGWDYKSTSSFITLSFWVKSSVAQSFGGFIRTHDGSQMTFPFETGALTADTWTKITRIIPGNGAIGFSNDNGTGMEINISQFWGTNYTASGKTLDAWSRYSNDSRLKDFPASTWYTTNDSTFELTGVQFEVGSVATDFEFRSFAVEKGLCERYYQRGRYSSYCQVGTPGTYYFSRGNVPLFTPMRASITGTLNAASSVSNRYFAFKTWADQTNVTTAPGSVSFSSRVGDGGDGPHTDVISVDISATISSGSSNAPLPANGPGSNNVYPIEYYDVELDSEL